MLERFVEPNPWQRIAQTAITTAASLGLLENQLRKEVEAIDVALELPLRVGLTEAERHELNEYRASLNNVIQSIARGSWAK